ncbi:MAG: hypothetical protein K5860_07735 [Bacteroidales bacterium]|nr:hypothetical protein [Bacteroidales bacterium]
MEHVRVLQDKDIQSLRDMRNEVEQMNDKIIERITTEGIDVERSDEAVYMGVLVNSLDRIITYYESL